MTATFSQRQGVGPAGLCTNPDQGFAQPEQIYAPSIFWFWNGADDLADPAHFAEMAKGMGQQGLNPGYVHARHYRYGQSYWLSDNWYTCFGAALETAKADGTCLSYTMGDPCFPDKYLLSDHREFPHFPVGGLTLSGHPELKAVSLDYSCLEVPDGGHCQVPESFFAVAVKLNKTGALVSSSLTLLDTPGPQTWQAPDRGDWRIYAFSKMLDFPSQYKINFLDRRLAGPWLELENTKYDALFSEHFGETMKGVFFDLEGFFGYKIAWSDDLAAQYAESKGCDIRLRMPLLIDEDEEGLWTKARWDWFDVVGRLYAECVFRPLDRWCRANGMYSTCHFWEENLLEQATRVADFMGMLRELSMPGTDALFRTIYEPRYFKEAQSVAEFEGRQLMCEAFGIIGWHVTPEELKAGANSAVAMGVTHLVPHGINSNRDITKVSYPPDFYDWNPYWRHVHLWSDFVRRASHVNDHGRLMARVLLFCPLESVCALVGGGYFDPRQTAENIWSDAGEQGIPRNAEIVAIEEAYTQAIQNLYDARIDSLVADTHYLQQMKLEDACLKLGDFSFQSLVLPPLKLISLQVARIIRDFAQAGGKVYALGTLPDSSAENGQGDARLRCLMDELREAAGFTDASDGLQALIDGNADGLTPCVQFESGHFPLIASRREIKHKSFFWLANNGAIRREFVLRIEHVTGGASVWNCEDGTRNEMSVDCLPEGGVRIEMTLEPYEGCWLVFDPQQETRPGRPTEKRRLVRALTGDWRVRVNPQNQPAMTCDRLGAPDWLLDGTQTKPLESWLNWGLKSFSGFVDYELDLELDQISGDEMLELGQVKHMAEVWVNGEWAGARLWPPFTFLVGDKLRPGKNTLQVKVGNLVINALTQNTEIQWKWFPIPPDEQLECGLFGPVTLAT
jgi:hypothetical protein